MGIVLLPTSKQRLLYALRGVRLDRAPVVCLGGAMSAAVTDVLEAVGIDFRQVHSDSEALANAAVAIAETTGFENIGLPLCATVEAEAFGSSVTPASTTREPRLDGERFSELPEPARLDVDQALGASRISTLLEAVAIVSEMELDRSLVVNVLGPMTLAHCLVEPTELLRQMISAPSRVHALLERLVHFTATLMGRLTAVGAEVIAVHEDSGDPKSVGLRRFEEFTARHLSALIETVRRPIASAASSGGDPSCVCPACRITTRLDEMRREVPMVVHCCEMTAEAWPALAGIPAAAWSIGATTSAARLREKAPGLVLLGNLSTNLLDRASTGSVRQQVRRALAEGVGIVAPECGLAMSTPLATIRALVDEVRGKPVAQENTQHFPRRDADVCSTQCRVLTTPNSMAGTQEDEA